MVEASLLVSAVVPVDEVRSSVGATVDDAGAVLVSAIGAAVLAAGEGDGSFLYILLPRRTSFSRKPGFFSSVAGVDVASTGESLAAFVAVVAPLVVPVVVVGAVSLSLAVVASVPVVLSFFPNPRKEDMRRDDPDWPPAAGLTAGPSW